VPLQHEDTGAAESIMGNPAPQRPLSHAQMAGAQKQQVNQMRRGPLVPGAARLGVAASENGQPSSDKQEPEPKPTDAHIKGMPGATPPRFQDDEVLGKIDWSNPLGSLWWQLNAPQPNADQGAPKGALGPEPAGTSDPQAVWDSTQYWGRVINAAIDPKAIHASAQNIEHDNSIQGRIAQGTFQIYNDPVHDALWNVMPYVLQMAAEWEPWLWAPSLAAAAPKDPTQIPSAVGGIFHDDLFHPRFEDPAWYARMGGYLLAAAVAARGGSEPAARILDYSRTLPGLERFSSHLDRIFGGPTTGTRFFDPGKTPIRLPAQPVDTARQEPIELPDGTTVQPGEQPAYDFAQWWRDGMEGVQEGESIIARAPKVPAAAYVELPSVAQAGEVALREVRPDTSKLLADLAQKLELPPTASAEDIRAQIAYLTEQRELSPSLSRQILDDWQKLGPALGMPNPVRYWHPAEAPFRNVIDSLSGIGNHDLQDKATRAMRAANGLHADIRSGVHALGNDLAEALAKGILGHGRSSDFYGERMVAALEKVLTTADSRRKVLDAIEQPEKYASLSAHEKWAVDFIRRMQAEVADESQRVDFLRTGRKPNFVYRTPAYVKNLDAVLRGVPESVRSQVRNVSSRSPFARVRQEHRAVQLVQHEGELRAEDAYKTVHEANAAKAKARASLAADLQNAAKDNPELAKVIADPAKLNALLKAEIPDLETDIIASLRGGFLPYVKALQTHKVIETARHTTVQGEDGIWRPLAVTSRSGIETVPKGQMREDFEKLHGAKATQGTYRALGYNAVKGLSEYRNLIFHPRFADPINRALDLAKPGRDPILKVGSVARKLIMLNPLWHATNMLGRFEWLTTMHPVSLTRTLLKSKGVGELTREQAQAWWDAQQHEGINHGLLPPRLNEDVTGQIGKFVTQATGDLDGTEAMGAKEPVRNIKNPAAARAMGAVKGIDHWWQSHVNDRFWKTYNDFAILAYIVEKEDALRHGMAAPDARLFAASRANRWAGMVSPERWMYNPTLHKATSYVAFAPNWWRTFPGLFLNTYDRLGMKGSPAGATVWSANAGKAIAAMIVAKLATDNALNWLMSGHWQFQNPDGYKTQITMDRFFPVDPKTGAHTVMEDPFQRQPTDIEKALGMISHENSADVVAARQSPLLQALETAANFDLYQTVRHGSLRTVDPSRGLGQSPAAAGAGLASLFAGPFSWSAQTALEGINAQDGSVNWGPFKGTHIPGWAMRAFDPNQPMSGLLSLLGVRGGYPYAVKSDAPGLSSHQEVELHKAQADYNDYLLKQQTAVMGGGMTLYEWRQHYTAQSAAHANQIKGLTAGTSDYMQGAYGLLSRYEALYNDPAVLDANGDINWSVLRQKQNALEASSDPSTWREMNALKNQRAAQFPIIKVYDDTLTNYHNFQDTWASQHGTAGEQLRQMVADASASGNYTQYEKTHRELAQFQADKKKWELTTKQGFMYGMFTDSNYVMRVLSPTYDPAQIQTAEARDLRVAEQMEQSNQYLSASGAG
jgi:hypothetical protein